MTTPMTPGEKNIHDSVDARDWAKLWLETLKEHPEIATDEGTMIGWFANAIMAGMDSEYRTKAAEVVALRLEHSAEIETYRQRDIFLNSLNDKLQAEARVQYSEIAVLTKQVEALKKDHAELLEASEKFQRQVEGYIPQIAALKAQMEALREYYSAAESLEELLPYTNEYGKAELRLMNARAALSAAPAPIIKWLRVP